MKILLLLSILVLPAISIAQTKIFIDTLKQDPYFTASKDSLILKFDTITPKQFEKYRNKYKPLIDTNKNYLAKTDTSFTLKTNSSGKIFYSDYKYYSAIYDYIGFFPTLNLYLLNYGSATNAVQYLFIVDANTGKKYGLNSWFDNGIELPVVSPKSDFIVTFANNVFERNNSYFMIIKVDTKNNSYVLKNYAEILTWDFEVVEAFWVNDKTFVMQTTEHPTERQFFVKAKL